MEKFLIVGGGFNNKGAESMLLSLITELRNKYTNCEIYVEIESEKLFEKENDTYDVNLFKFNKKDRYHLTNWHLRLFDKINRKEESELSKIVKSIDVIFDISGYALSSQFQKFVPKNTLQTIAFAKLFKKPIIFMPQSFGPFDFPKKWRMPIPYIKKQLSYADLIFCREKHGFDLLNNLGLKNIILSNDMVIQSNKPYEHVFLKDIPAEKINIEPNSVLIIPNKQVFKRMNPDTYMNFYKTVINHLLSKNYHIYITYYSGNDKEICKNIKEMFADNPNVKNINSYLNFKTFENIIPKFDFIISSRFHSIVHAYKQYKPTIAFGWAIKYKELLKSVHQSDFNIDCRENIDIESVKNKINYLIEHKEDESSIIEKHVKTIQKESCFNIIWKHLDTLNIKKITKNFVSRVECVKQFVRQDVSLLNLTEQN